jgi:hypothetical protein
MHSACSACKKMKWETKMRGRELPRMEALSFMVLVAHGGIVVMEAGCGDRHWFSFFSPLLHRVFHSPYQQCSCLSAVASWRCCWWRRRGRLVVVRGGRCFCFSVFSSSSSCLLLVLLSVLFFLLFFVHSPLSLFSFIFSFFSPLFPSLFFLFFPSSTSSLPFLAFIGQLNALWW